MANSQIDTNEPVRNDFICDKYFSLESNICDALALYKALDQVMYRDDLQDLKYELLDGLGQLLTDLHGKYNATEVTPISAKKAA